MWQAKIIVGFTAVFNLLLLGAIIWLSFSGTPLPETPERPLSASTALLFTVTCSVNLWLAMRYLHGLWEQEQ